MRFARPYAWLIVLGLVFGIVNSGARNLRAYMLKPVMDEVAVPAQSLHESGPFRAWQLFGDGDKPPPQVRVEPDAAEEAAEKQRLATSIQKSLRRIAVVMLVVVLLLPLSEFGKSYVVEFVLGRVLVDLQDTLCAKLLALPLRFHHATTRGDTMSRLLNDAGRAHRALDLLFADVIQAVFALLIGASVLFYISWQLTLVALCIAPPIVGVISVFGRRIRKTSRRRQERTSDVTARLLQILGGIKLIKAFRAQAHEEASFSQDNQRLFRASMRVVRNRVTSKSLIEFLNNAMATVMPLLGVWLVIRGQWGITVGDLVAFLTVLATTYAPVKDLAKGWTELMDATPAAERFFEVLDAQGEPGDPKDAVRIDGVHQGVRFDHVSFSYGREPVLQDLDLDVRAGEVVAIVGRTGAGKTTLVDLLLRFYDPETGSISIDGVDLRRISRESLLDHVAVVSQEPFLFSGTIRDNVRYGRPGATDAEVLAAAKAAHVDEFVLALPDGYDTEVGEVGAKLSGGQRQRVTIARAILKNPAILIFDEATSALDAKSERYVQDAVDALIGDRTVFVIAHRLSTIRHADKIVVLEGGCVSRTGTHEELMASDGLYRELVRLQTQSG